MPSLSPTMEDGSIAQWSKKEGDEIRAGDVLCEVQTDKAVVALESEEDGILAKIIVPEKAPNIKVGTLIAVLASPDEDWKEVASSAASLAAEQPKSTQPPKTEVEQSVVAEATPKPSQPVEAPATANLSRVGPAVRLLLQLHNLDGTGIPASGPHGTLLKGDVLSFLTSHPTPDRAQPSNVGTTTPPPVKTTALGLQASYTDIPLTAMRMTIAKRLTFSKTSIPHAYVRSIATLDKIMDLRKQLKQRAGIKVSVNDFITKACALGLRLVPELNAIADPSTNSCKVHPTVDICMAVATPAGLITPILQSADQTPVSQLSLRAADLAKRARDGKLQLHEFQGGSFTISNLGMFGIREFTAIINPPQVAILAVGSGLLKPTDVSPSDPDRLLFSNRMSMTLSIDSRFVDGAMAGRFLTHVSRLLSDHPEILLADDPAAKVVLGTGQGNQTDDFDTILLSMNTNPALRSTPVSS